MSTGKMAGWIEMPSGMQVSLGPSGIVLDRGLPPSREGASPEILPPPNFGQYVRWQNGWMGIIFNSVRQVVPNTRC